MTQLEKKFKFTAARIERLSAPAEGYEYYWDSTFGGFGMRVSSRGVKAWTLLTRINGKPAQLRVGRYPAVTLAAARDIAGKKIQMIERGVDPREERKKRREADAERVLTFGKLAEQYLAECVKLGRGRRGKNKGNPFRTAGETERRINKVIVPQWKNKPVDQITSKDVSDLLDRVATMNGERMSNSILTLVRSIFAWAIGYKGIDITSPVRPGMERGAEISRERVLTDAEVRLLWQALDAVGYPVAPYYRVLLLTGQRRSDVANMQDAEVDWETKVWTIPGTRHKSGRDHAVPLTTSAVELLQDLPREVGNPGFFIGRGGGAFSGFAHGQDKVSKALAAMDVGDGFGERWTIHDLRRTAATGMQNMGIAPYIVDACQGRSVKGVGAVYMRGDVIEQKRLALQKWDDKLMSIINPEPDQKVVRLAEFAGAATA